MSSVAVFIDAGYLFAQGSTALTGSKQPRSLLKLNETAAVAELVAIAQAKSGGGRLLRIYWYDGGLSSGQLTLEHAALAHTDYIKLRLGFMNSQGQQKGVDSLIVTDLIELARNRAISDAVLLSGDEDVRAAPSRSRYDDRVGQLDRRKVPHAEADRRFAKGPCRSVAFNIGRLFNWPRET